MSRIEDAIREYQENIEGSNEPIEMPNLTISLDWLYDYDEEPY